MMPHPLELKLARLRRRARQYILSKAVARAWCGAIGWAIAGRHRHAISFQDRGLRAVSSLVLLTVLAVASCAACLAGGFAESRLSDVQIAQRLERYYPRLRGRLASAVEFVREGPMIRWPDPPRCAGR